MHILNKGQKISVYSLLLDETADIEGFKVYNFDGNSPNQSDLQLSHHKDYYVLAFIKRAGGANQLIDIAPNILQDNEVYFSGPSQIIEKEGFEELGSNCIAFTKKFLSSHEGASLLSLPLIQNVHGVHQLLLTEGEIVFVTNLLDKINVEYQNPTEWQKRMIIAYLTVLLTYLSRLYTEQY